METLDAPKRIHLLAITVALLQLVSDWMFGGDLLGYIEEHSDANRLGLVDFHPAMLIPPLTLATNYPAPSMASTVSTPATPFMGISREYVVILYSVLPPMLTPSQPNIVDSSGSARIADFWPRYGHSKPRFNAGCLVPAWSHRTMGCARGFERGGME